MTNQNQLLQSPDFIEARKVWRQLDDEIARLEKLRQEAIGKLLLFECDLHKNHGEDWLELIWDLVEGNANT